MELTIAQLTQGLTSEHDLMFASRPVDPEMRESASVWISDDSGQVNLPRFGIEAEAKDWDQPLCTGNVCFADGRVLSAISKGAKHSPFGQDGRRTVLGAGPLAFECIEPFRLWIVKYDGTIACGRVGELIEGTFDPSRQVPFKFNFELRPVTPAWVMDNTPEKIAGMTAADRVEAEYMGIGWRFEQCVQVQGSYEIEGRAHELRGTGLRIKRQSVRPLGGFRGHVWQSALFPDGRAFGYIAYPPREVDGKAYNEAYVYQDGRMHTGRATLIPWLRKIIPSGDDVTLQIETDLGQTRITGKTISSYFYRKHPGMPGLDLQQAGVRYAWDDSVAYGMLERSSASDLTDTE
jgi:hypothetical protein